jgi:hypothetical protein
VRTQGSGSRFTARKKVGKDTEAQSGDITYNIPEAKPLIDYCSFELKTGYGRSEKIFVKKKGNFEEKKIIKPWGLLDFLDSSQDTPVFAEMWEQAVCDAGAREPVVIFRRNRKQACIAIRETFFCFLQSFVISEYKKNTIRLKLDESSIIFMKLEEFFDWCTNPLQIFSLGIGNTNTYD